MSPAVNIRLPFGRLGFTFLGAIVASLPLKEAKAVVEVTLTKPIESRIDIPAAQAAEAAKAIPGNVSVVDESNIEDRRAATVKDLLDFTPGVFVQPRDSAEAARLSIRGSGIARSFQGRGLLLLQDDIPISTADGSFDFQAIDPWTVRYATVYRGANALSIGSSNLGGAIAFTSPTGYSAPPLLARTEFGSFGEEHSQLSSGQKSGAWDAWGSAIDFREDGYRRQEHQRSERFNGNLGWQGQNVESRFYLAYLDSSDAEIPGTLTKAQLFDDPRQANPANARGNYARPLQNLRLANRTQATLGDGHLLSTIYYSHRDLENPSTVYIDSGSDDVGLRESYRVKAGEDEWLGGVNLAYGTTDETRNRNIRGYPGRLVVTRDEEATSVETYLQYDHAFTSALHLLGSTQFAYAGREIEEHYPASRAQDTDYTGWSPRLGLRYDLAAGPQLYANLSRSFEPPTLSELSAGNTPGFSRLDDQTATTAEIGTRGKAAGLNWDLAYYHSRIAGEFITYRFADGSTSTVNADHTTHDGIELGLDGRLAESALAAGDALDMQFAYTFSYFKLRDDPVFGSNRLAGLPEHYLQGRLLYRHPSGIDVGPTFEWVPRAYDIDLANTEQTRPYALLGLTASYTLPDSGLTLSLEGRNLFDKTYIATTGVIPNAAGKDQSQFYPGDGRAVYAGLQWRW